MRIAIILGLLFVSYVNAVNGQLYKNTWLIGGNLSYSKSNTKSTDQVLTKYSFLNVNANIGYFPWDKVVSGVLLQFNTTGERTPEVDGTTRVLNSRLFGVGPFLRYYLLKPDNRINLLSEASFIYSTGRQKTTGFPAFNSNSLNYNLFAGPVIYFNSSVGMEFLIGYNRLVDLSTNTNQNYFRIKIGFQIHLENE